MYSVISTMYIVKGTNLKYFFAEILKYKVSHTIYKIQIQSTGYNARVSKLKQSTPL